MTKTLDVYLHNRLIGQLKQYTSGRLSFSYTKPYCQAANPALSLSMPLREEPYQNAAVTAFFSGILPDDIARHRLAACLGLSEKNAFALLKVVGGECAGALSLYPEGYPPPTSQAGEVEILNDAKLKEILALLKQRPLLADIGQLRLSLAGAQEKIAIGFVNDAIALVHGSTPTSHILKPLIHGVTDSVHNEFFCMRLAAAINIDVAEVSIYWLDKLPYLLIKRYDRFKENGVLKRWHQEDFCQAMGIMPEFKYEREGGPSIKKCLALIQTNCKRPAATQIDFLNRIIFNYLIGNADAHGKNFSLLYKSQTPELAPAYDLLCTEVYPGLSRNMAMKIGRHYNPEYVFRRHWEKLVANLPTSRLQLNRQIEKTSQLCLAKAKTLKENLEAEGIQSTVFNQILEIIEKKAAHLALS